MTLKVDAEAVLKRVNLFGLATVVVAMSDVVVAGPDVSCANGAASCRSSPPSVIGWHIGRARNLLSPF